MSTLTRRFLIPALAALGGTSCAAGPGAGDAPTSDSSNQDGSKVFAENDSASVAEVLPDFIADPNASTNADISAVPFDPATETCAEVVASSFKPTAVLEVILDTSRSMSDPLPGRPVGNPTKLAVTVDALQEAIGWMDPTTWVGLLNYPAGDYTAEQCLSGAEVASPQQLGDPGSTHREKLTAGLAGLATAGATPTLEAMLLGLRRLMNLNVAARKFLVLITDGAPSVPATACPTNGETEDQLYEAVDLAKRNDINTFVIGAPGSEFAASLLSQMSVRGRTPRQDCSEAGPHFCHYDLSQIADLSGSLKAALDTITREATACSYDIPAAPAGAVFAAERVNVRYFDAQGAPHDLFQDATPGCADGWYYAGNKVELCAGSCAQVQADPTVTVEVLFGCETRIVVK